MQSSGIWDRGRKFQGFLYLVLFTVFLCKKCSLGWSLDRFPLKIILTGNGSSELSSPSTTNLAALWHWLEQNFACELRDQTHSLQTDLSYGGHQKKVLQNSAYREGEILSSYIFTKYHFAVYYMRKCYLRYYCRTWFF